MASPSEELQGAIFALLSADAGVTEIVGAAIYDGKPGQYPCVSFGPTSVVPDDADCLTARSETVQLDCWVKDDSRLRMTKRLVDAVKVALHKASASLPTHGLVSMEVTLMQSFMDRDGLTGHGVVQVECEVEEN
ncbi:DUF3168 domain-containing protein [Sedimentimonas flavescens]|uniref:DUF3168 domain-containing protein n=1 Tax=Sedimentimonas flavescens TaxID=2851012 RepID=A0ABT2ZVH7_9RHOB|nr:DUF3168 domain-containing protein [Sedimentimonas flavescens]MCV2877607.1 DUF3168 domain-containing protein [Sedimentimonas flavescens]